MTVGSPRMAGLRYVVIMTESGANDGRTRSIRSVELRRGCAFASFAQHLPDERDAFSALRPATASPVDHRHRTGSANRVRTQIAVGKPIAQTDVHRRSQPCLTLARIRRCE